jgi:hypothetical protein
MMTVLYILVGLWMLLIGYAAVLGILFLWRYMPNDDGWKSYKNDIRYINNPKHQEYIQRRLNGGMNYQERLEPTFFGKIKLWCKRGWTSFH